MEKLISLVLKAMNLSSKFFLLIVLAKYSSPEIVSIFGLYWSTLVLSSGIMGVEVYSYTARNIINSDEERNIQLRKHFAFLLIIAAVITPIISLWQYEYGAVSLLLTLIFPFHLLFEFFSQEITRILVPLKKPLASIVLATIRSSIWIFPVIGIIYFYDAIPVLEITILSWLFGSFFAFVVGGWLVYDFTKGDVIPILDFHWIRKAVKVSLVIFIGTLCLRLILSADRFLIDLIFDKKILAVYIFYGSIVFSVVGLLETSVSAWHYPSMVKSIQLNNSSDYFIKLKRFLFESSISGAAILIAIVIVTPLVISSFLDPIYSSDMTAFYIMCSAIWFYTVTMPFYYTLYGLGRDKTILMINLTSLVLMVFWAFTYMGNLGLPGAGIMFGTSLVSISLMRTGFCLYIYAKEYKIYSPLKKVN